MHQTYGLNGIINLLCFFTRFTRTLFSMHYGFALFHNLKIKELEQNLTLCLDEFDIYRIIGI